MLKYLLTLLIAFSLLFGCTDQFNFTDNPNAKLSFSTDTVHFDTVFTTIGSTTLQFRFYNNNNNAVKTTIQLAGGNQSNFRLNIDGLAANSLTDYEIRANDSAFIFVEVNIDPQNSNSPMVIEDSVLFFTNGNQQNIKLVAYGQDIHLYNDSVLDTRTWINDKPYLIYNSILIDKNQTLNIEAGTRIHFHNESALWVLGTLKVNGTVEEPVIFTGSRLDEWYRDNPGQWYGVYRTDSFEYLTGGIHFWQGSTNNVIDHAIIKNGVKGIQVDLSEESTEPTLTLSNSTVMNMSGIGLLAQNSRMLVYNSAIVNCGIYAVALSYGGKYEFYHTTIGNYYVKNAKREQPSLALNNYYIVDNEATVFDMDANFGNCIIYGKLDNELLIDQFNTDLVNFNYLFDHCLIKLKPDYDLSNPLHFKSIISHRDSLPKFINPDAGDFRLDTLSSAKDKGTLEYLDFITVDMLGNSRTKDLAPDLGAFERIE
ncbi:MAG: hypothetical protein CVU09_07030 [Bacteroidetes bacterium HGW-Bacteroidetes-4]|jgi:hypothetical protein|nr:MAG: hypothetical protein CVU09_07030 [Bacteroidetes bacterium HGW-Bacteroidetes-4]